MEEHKGKRVKIRWLRKRWWPFVVALILLGIIYFLIPSEFERLAIFALVAVTLLYAFFTHEQAEATRGMAEEMARPLLVPVGGTEGLARLAEMPRLDNEQGWLHVHNVGLGPAVNIAIRLELRPVNGSPTVQLDEMLNTVEPLPAGSMGLVRQWKSSEKPIEIYDDHWIVISYDDLRGRDGRHFETEARRIRECDSWVGIKTVQVKQPRPRVREVDYYAGAFGRDERRK